MTDRSILDKMQAAIAPVRGPPCRRRVAELHLGALTDDEWRRLEEQRGSFPPCFCGSRCDPACERCG